MKRSKNDLEDLDIPEFDFSRARRPTPQERKMFHEAVENLHKRGRPQKVFGKYKPVTIRLHPYVLAWAKAEAKRRGMGYQTFINQTLLAKAA